MDLPISSEVLVAELKLAEEIISKWRARIEDGLPGVDIPSANSQEALGNFVLTLRGELLVVSSKCDNIAHILAGD